MASYEQTQRQKKIAFNVYTYAASRTRCIVRMLPSSDASYKTFW